MIKSFFQRRKAQKMAACKFEYMMLAKLQMDCLYCISTGSKRHLHYDSVSEHIKAMKKLYRKVPYRPEWLNMNNINQYELELSQHAK